MRRMNAKVAMRIPTSTSRLSGAALEGTQRQSSLNEEQGAAVWINGRGEDRLQGEA